MAPAAACLHPDLRETEPTPGRSSPPRAQETPQDCLWAGRQRQGVPRWVAGGLRGRIRQKWLLCARERVKAGTLSDTHLARPRQDLDRHADTHRPKDRHVHTLRESCARALRPDLETSLRKTTTVTRILTRVSIEAAHPGGPSRGSCRKEGDRRARGGEHLLCLLHPPPPPPASAFAGCLCEGDPCRRWVEGQCFRGTWVGQVCPHRPRGGSTCHAQVTTARRGLPWFR